MNTTFAGFVASVEAILNGAARDKGYSEGGADGPNPTYAWVEEHCPGHVAGEIIYKVLRFQACGRLEDLEKVAAWAFLEWRRVAEGQDHLRNLAASRSPG